MRIKKEIVMKFYDFMDKDIRYDNESKKAIVSMRWLYLILMIAFALNIVWTSGAVFESFAVQVIVLLAIHVLLFIQTYFSRTRLALVEFNIYIAAWAFLLIPCFGWHAGIQNYLLILIPLFFFATHLKIRYKVIFSAVVLFGRILLSFIYGEQMHSAVNGSQPDIFFEITNISAVFTCVALFSYLYSRESTAAEDKLMKYNDRLQVAANTDPLTGLFNRRFTYDWLENIKEEGEITSISIAIGDIDFFKNVNDNYGHDAGDEVLKAISKTMKEMSGENALIARWGGEEFLIVYPEMNGDEAYYQLSLLHIKIGNMVIRSGDQEIRVTMTFGLTELDFHKDIDRSIKRADDNLYIGKKSGRNQIVY